MDHGITSELNWVKMLIGPISLSDGTLSEGGVCAYAWCSVGRHLRSLSLDADSLSTSLKYSYKSSACGAVLEAATVVWSRYWLWFIDPSLLPTRRASWSEAFAAHPPAPISLHAGNGVGNKASTRRARRRPREKLLRTHGRRRRRRNCTNNKPTPFQADKNHEFFITRR